MIKITAFFCLVSMLLACSKSSDNQEIDVSEGQTNWTKIAYSDTLQGPYARDFPNGVDITGISIYPRDIAIRGNHVVIGGNYQPWKGNATIWESKDAGLTWEQTFREYDSCDGCHPIYEIAIPADNVVYALSLNSGKRRMFKSKNGEWSLINLEISLIGFGSDIMHFFDENIGIVGNYKTEDGGLSWHIIEDLTELAGVDRILSNFFLDAQIGYCLTSSAIFKTINGGDNWTLLYQTSTQNIAQVFFLDEYIGFLRTSEGLLKTEDAGLTWRSVFSGWLSDVSFANNTTGFITTSEGVYKTVDVGETWTLNYTSSFFDFAWNGPLTYIYAPSFIKFEDESLGILGGPQLDFNSFPNGKAYIARTTTLGE